MENCVGAREIRKPGVKGSAMKTAGDKNKRMNLVSREESRWRRRTKSEFNRNLLILRYRYRKINKILLKGKIGIEKTQEE